MWAAVIYNLQVVNANVQGHSGVSYCDSLGLNENKMLGGI
jgi:hypothetical protein